VSDPAADAPVPDESSSSSCSLPAGEVRTVRLCDVSDLSAGEAKRVDVDGYRIAVVRVGDEWFAIDDECSHADFSLAEGEVDEDELTIECWKHGSLFSLTTGEPETLPATRPVATYNVTVQDSVVSVALPAPTDGENR